MTIAFFHQNATSGVQGGIERYLSTLVNQGKGRCILVCEAAEETDERVLGLHLPLAGKVPQWLRFVLAVWINIRAIRDFLRLRQVTTIEFSRPEYALFSFLLRGKKVFTLHGTGPSSSERGKFFIHHATCWLLPLLADEIRIVGRDARGLPMPVRFIMRNKTIFIDAWFDNAFQTTPFPETNDVIKVFYAGRLAKMKNPDLLYAIIRKMKHDLGNRIHFFYFGSDGANIPSDLHNNQIMDRGLLSADQLAQAIGECHMGILCSGFGEGSPFIIVETLASGRGYVLPPLIGLQKTYPNHSGIRFAADYTPKSFAQEISTLFNDIKSGKLTPELIRQSIASQSKSVAAELILSELLG